MRKGYKNTIVLAVMLMLTLPLSNLITATNQEKTLETSTNKSLSISTEIENMKVTSLEITEINDKIEPNNILYINKDSSITIDIEKKEFQLPSQLPESQLPAEVERLKELIPRTFAEAEAEIVPLRNRFLMWTNDLEHIMWGNYRNNIFVGQDNQGNRAWGLYCNGYFVGIYDGTDVFWGKYSYGRWKAFNLFGEDTTWGKYVLSPTLIIALKEAEIIETPTNSLLNKISTIGPRLDSSILYSNQASMSIAVPEKVEKLIDTLPDSYKTAEDTIGLSRNKFLMWTYNLKNIMWGHYGNNIFVGQDNQGKNAWGIFVDGFFVGKYDGTDVFWGRYGNGHWRAYNLFRKTWTSGRYIIYPNLVESTDNNTP